MAPPERWGMVFMCGKGTLTLRYACIQSFFWMGFASIMGFASVFLLDAGFSNAGIGAVIAGAGMLSALLQPVAASLAEGRWGLKRMVYGVCAGLTGLGAGVAALYVADGPLWITGALYGGCILLLQLALPLVNALGTEAINRGGRLNWGAARGAGSIAYAVMAWGLGLLTKSAGAVTVPLLIAGGFALLSAALAAYPLPGGEGGTAAGGDRGTGSPMEFLRRYPRFGVLLIGTTLLYTGHAILNNYTFQIVQSKGGSSAEMGTAAALAAFCELPPMFLFAAMVRRVRCDVWMRVAGAFFTLKLFCTWLAPGVTVFYGVQVLQMMGWGVISVASVFYINELMDKGDAIKGQAYYTMTITLGTVLGSLAGGWLLDTAGMDATLLYTSGASLAGTVIVFAAAQRSRDGGKVL